MKNILLCLLIMTRPILNAHILDSDTDTDPVEFMFVIQPLSKPQQNCLNIRHLMDAVPTYSPVSTGITSLFRNLVTPKPKQEMKSFRALALRIIEQFNFDEQDPAEAEELAQMKEVVPSLRRLKTEFHEMYFKDRKMDDKEEIKNSENLEGKIDKVIKKMKENAQEQAKL